MQPRRKSPFSGTCDSRANGRRRSIITGRYKTSETLSIFRPRRGTQIDLISQDRLPEIKERLVDMALKSSGIWDTARVLKISPTTVRNALKIKSRRSAQRQDMVISLWANRYEVGLRIETHEGQI
jgi:transposase-like protein